MSTPDEHMSNHVSRRRTPKPESAHDDSTSSKDAKSSTDDGTSDGKDVKADMSQATSTGTGMSAQSPGENFTPLGVGEKSESAKERVSAEKTKGGGGRKKVTAAEAEQMITEYREKRAEKRRQRIESLGPKESIIRNVVAVACIVGAIGSFIGVTVSAGEYEDQSAANNEEIASLQGGLNDVDKRVESIPQPEVMVAAIDDANMRAQELVDLMNEIAAFDLTDDPTKDPENVSEYQALFDKLRGFYTSPALNGGSFNPASVWFAPNMSNPDPEKGGSVPMPTNMWKWEVVPTRAVARDGNVRVLFEQRLQSGEDKGVLMAWCEGQYDPQVRKFHSMVLGVTASGRDYIGATDTQGGRESAEGKRRQEVMDQALKDAQALGDGPAEDTPDVEKPHGGMRSDEDDEKQAVREGVVREDADGKDADDKAADGKEADGKNADNKDADNKDVDKGDLDKDIDANDDRARED